MIFFRKCDDARVHKMAKSLALISKMLYTCTIEFTINVVVSVLSEKQYKLKEPNN